MLVVESECSIVRPLRHAGHEVVVASTPDEARAMAEIVSFDAIVLGGARSDAASCKHL